MFIDELRKLNTEIQPYGFIAGGLCRSLLNNEEIKDIDIFCRTESDFEILKSLLLKPLTISDAFSFDFQDGYVETRENDLVYEFTRELFNKNYRIQIIKPRNDGNVLTFGTPQEVVSRFDFSVCRLYLDINGEICSVDEWEEALSDIQKKKLIVKNIICPISSMRRCMKYVRKGYFLPLNEMMKLFIEFQKRDIDLEVLIKQVQEVEEENSNSINWYELFSKFGID